MGDNSEVDETPLPSILQDMVLDSVHVETFLNDLATVAAQRVGGGNPDVSCAISLLRPRRNATAASSTEQARQLDEIQYKFNEGPCLSAARDNTVFNIPDVVLEQRFRPYLDAVQSKHVRSILAVPIPLADEARAALNLYASAPDAFDQEAVTRSQIFAREASKTLTLAVRIAHLTETNLDLKTAMQSRTTIDLAIGIIMGQNRCSQETAFKILRSASIAHNIKLRDVAATVVQSASQGSVTTHFDE